MPLPKVMYQLDQYHNGQHIIVKMVNGVPEGEEGRFWDAQEAAKTALELQLAHIAKELFPYECDKTDTLVNITRTYFQDLMRILPPNQDADYARRLIRQAFNFARTAILLDGIV